MNDTTKNQVRSAIIASGVEQFRSLWETHFASISKAAEQSFVSDSDQSDLKARATMQVEWDAVAMAPKVSVRIAWSAKFKDESEQDVDPLQEKLPIDEVQS